MRKLMFAALCAAVLVSCAPFTADPPRNGESIEESQRESAANKHESVNSAAEVSNQGAEASSAEKGATVIDVPLICQHPSLPTGCESVAATMLLNFYGVDLRPEEFAASWLECGDFYRRGDTLFGPDPELKFAGDPFSPYSCGCFEQPVADAINENCRGLKAVPLKGESFEKLCREYVAAGNPVLIWATIRMEPPREGNVWITEEGKTVSWLAGEHCLVLVGLGDGEVFLNDPDSGERVVYPRELVKTRYEQIGSRALCIESARAVTPPEPEDAG